MTLQIYNTMARYNAWMNGKLYAVCAELSDEALRQDRQAPFRSIKGTLDHLLVTDKAWLGRFTDVPFQYTSLSQELHADFTEMRAERERLDQLIIDWTAVQTEERLRGILKFTPMSDPRPREIPLWICVTHMFNHQTHHRGQLTTLLEQAGVDFGVTDLLRMFD